MKKLLLIAILVTSFISCNKTPKADKENLKNKTTNSLSIIKSPINFNSNTLAKRYKTVISEQYNKQDVNFASYYTLATWGCGSGCMSGVIIDTRDGIVYSMPENDKNWGGSGSNYIDSKKTSNLLLNTFVIQSATGESEETHKYWEWNENLKKFKFHKEEIKLVKKK